MATKKTRAKAPAKLVPGKKFEEVVGALRAGKRVRRRNWHTESSIFATGGLVFVIFPGVAFTHKAAPCAWVPYAADVLATDWEIVK